ncbi:MAG: phosphoribosyl-AMP cyclohydrolase [Candidatus Margulisiibacteriota bacterium]
MEKSTGCRVQGADELKDLEIKYNSDGLIPAIAQDFETGEVLMLAYMNRESLKKTAEQKKAWYWSRSRKKLWMKGEESGHVQDVKELYYDCDADTILLKIKQTGPACHTGNRSCFYRKIKI